MGAYVSMPVKQGGRLVVEAASIIGVTMAVGSDYFETAPKERAITLIVRGGETIEVINVSVDQILLRAAQVRKDYKEQNRVFLMYPVDRDDGQ